VLAHGGGLHDRFYDRVLALHREGILFPDDADRADFTADAPQRLMRRVVVGALSDPASWPPRPRL
jgi:hypothetical protein